MRVFTGIEIGPEGPIFLFQVPERPSWNRGQHGFRSRASLAITAGYAELEVQRRPRVMTIQLPPDVENSLIAKVHSGLFPSLDAAMTKAAYLLLEQIEQAPPAKPKSKQKAKQAKLAKPGQPRLTLAELHQEMLASGLITQLPNPAEDIDDDDPDDQPIAIEGEPLSETIIRERR
jgi:hypothetical protein